MLRQLDLQIQDDSFGFPIESWLHEQNEEGLYRYILYCESISLKQKVNTCNISEKLKYV